MISLGLGRTLHAPSESAGQRPSMPWIRIVIAIFAALLAHQISAAPLNILVVGAHPDDPDICAGGTSALWAALGHHVKFLSLTNGDAGHQEMRGSELAQRRYKESQKAAERLGIDQYQILPNHDGELFPTLELRKQVIRAIREWKADVVIFPRPNDYHPDHRNTGLVVQDATYLVLVPSIVPDTAALRHPPLYLFCRDEFKRPNPFTPDIAIDITPVMEQKADALASHASQFYEWLPWVSGKPDAFRGTPNENRQLLGNWLKSFPVSDAVRASLKKWYGEERGAAVGQAEAFEICEYGFQPQEADIMKLFPMLPH